MDTSALKELGLTNREIEVYTKLIKIGESSAADIAKDSSISRTHVYEALKNLIGKGLVSSVTKDFKKYYLAANTSKLLEVVKETESKISNLIPLLEKIKKPNEVGPKIEVYEGKEGIKTIMMDTLKLKRSSEILISNVGEHTKEVMGPFAKLYFKEKQKKGIRSRVIFSKKFEFLDPTAEKRFMIKKDISPTLTIIYGNKVGIIFWLEKPMAVLIESKEAAKEYRQYFEVLWEQAKP